MNCRLFVAMLLFAAGSATAADLGRLFFTPAQRSALDTARKQNVRVEIDNEDTQERPAAPAAPVPQNVRVNGLIQRSDGQNTVWLNSKPVTERTSGGLNIATQRGDPRVKLSVPDTGRSMDLKVGQTAEITSGTIEESYRRRPQLKTEDKAAPAAAENDAARVQKRTAEPAPDSLESSSRLQRKPRAASRDAPAEAPAGGPDPR